MPLIIINDPALHRIPIAVTAEAEAAAAAACDWHNARRSCAPKCIILRMEAPPLPHTSLQSFAAGSLTIDRADWLLCCLARRKFIGEMPSRRRRSSCLGWLKMLLCKLLAANSLAESFAVVVAHNSRLEVSPRLLLLVWKWCMWLCGWFRFQSSLWLSGSVSPLALAVDCLVAAPPNWRRSLWLYKSPHPTSTISRDRERSSAHPLSITLLPPTPWDSMSKFP